MSSDGSVESVQPFVAAGGSTPANRNQTHQQLAATIKRAIKPLVSSVLSNPQAAAAHVGGALRQLSQHLQRGARGGQVRQLQHMLNQQGAHLREDGIMGRRTTAAVRQYQSGHQLQVDGVVGPQTRASLNGGGGAHDAPPLPNNGGAHGVRPVPNQGGTHGAQPVPNNQAALPPANGLLPRPHGLAGIMQTFGQPGDRLNLVTTMMPAGPNGKMVPVTFHRKVAGQLLGALNEIKARGLSHNIHSFDGTYNNRNKTGGHGKSVHAWGIAIDLNAGENPYGQSRMTAGQAQIAQIMRKWGFYQLPHDPMHFQYATGY
jgi:hypothetical protein